MVSLKDVLIEIKNKLLSSMSGAEVYWGNIPENPSIPSFLLLVAFANGKRKTFGIQENLLSIQIVYFGETDSDGNEKINDKLLALDSISPFLSSFNISVGSRNLKFDYETSNLNGDDNLSILLDFKYRDGLTIDVESFDLMENITFSEEG